MTAITASAPSHLSIPEVKISLAEPDASSPSLDDGLAPPNAENKIKLVVKSNAPEHSLLRRRSSSSCSRVDTLPLYSPFNPAPSYEKLDGRPASLCRSIRSEAPSYQTDVGDSSQDTILHIYHHSNHFSIHTAPDSTLEDFPQILRTRKPSWYNKNPQPFEYKPGWFKQKFGARSVNGRISDSRASDPRMAKYFVHTPTTSLGCSPVTVRLGPNRQCPIVCRIKEAHWWKSASIDFSDINGEGIIDHRGTFAENVRREGKVYKKPWYAAIQKKDKNPKEPIHLPAAKPEDLVKLTWNLTKEQVRLYEFQHRGVTFYWKGTQTTKYDKSKFWGPWCKYNHLKLVAELPYHGDPKDLPKKPQRRFTLGGVHPRKPNVREVVVAIYTSTLGMRKSGRLAIKEGVVDELLAYMKSLDKKNKDETEEEEKEEITEETTITPTVEVTRPKNKKSAIVFPKPVKKAMSELVFNRNRFEHIIVASCVGMIRQEKQKRDLARDIALVILEMALIPL